MAGIGPLEFLVVAFPGEELPDRVGSVLWAVEGGGDVRIVHAVAVTKDRDGQVRSAALADVGALVGSAAGYAFSGPGAGLISAADVDEVAHAIEAGSAGLALLVEHAWAREIAAVVRELGGALMSLGLADHRVEEAAAACSTGAALSTGWVERTTPEPVPVSPISTPPLAADGGDVVAQLSQLVDLAERGVLTQQEFAAAKARVLRHEQWW